MKEKQKRPHLRKHVYITEEEYAQAQQAAKEDGHTFSELNRRALRLYLDMRTVRDSGNPAQTWKAIHKKREI